LENLPVSGKKQTLTRPSQNYRPIAGRRGGRRAADPVRLGLVASLARPGGNLTGINFFNTELTAKRLELLRELVPAAARVAVFLNPTGPPDTQTTLREVEPAAALPSD
jgi:hypothetical protein